MRSRHMNASCVRRGIEKAKEFVAENIDALGEAPGRGIGADLVPHIERVALALRQFFGDQGFAFGEETVLRGAMDIGHALRWRGGLR